MRRHNPEKEKETRRRVVEAAELAFKTRGAREVTMDEIAKSLKMSKRTVYELFVSKENLLLQCIKSSLAKEEVELERLRNETGNVLEYVVGVLDYRMRELEGMSPCAIKEATSYREVREFIDEMEERRKIRAEKVLLRGVEEGYFSPSIDYKLVFPLLQAMVNFAINDPYCMKLSMQQIFHDTVLTYVSGIVTPKGQEIVRQFLVRHGR